MNLEKTNDLTLKLMAKVPEYLIKHSSKNFEGPVTLKIEKARKAIKNGYGLFMYGNTGAGKSVIASDMLCEWIRMQSVTEISRTLCIKRFGDFPWFMESRAFLDQLRQSYDGGNEKQHMKFNTARNKALLVIDDLYKGVAKEKIKDWAGPKFADLIENRHADNSPMIITSNFGLEQIAEFSHKSTASRIMERCEVIDFTEIEDVRIKNAKERNFDGDKR